MSVDELKKKISLGNFSENPLIGTLGDDFLVGRGAIYGDLGDRVSIIFVPDGVDIPFPITPPPTVFGNDVIVGLYPSLLISGDDGVGTTFVRFATSNATENEVMRSNFTLSGITTTWGNDTIFTVFGKNTIFGDSAGGDLLALGADGSTSIADGLNAHAFAQLSIVNGLFFVGHDRIFAGMGDDVIHGDTSAAAREPGGGLAIASNGGLAETFFVHDDSHVLMGDDLIHGGAGDDRIFGEGESATHEAFGGVANATSGGIATTSVIITNLSIVNGHDTLFGDAGNDVIYGEGFIYQNILHGGSASADLGSVAKSEYRIIGTEIISGDDSIDGGQGNDRLFGDFGIARIQVFEGQTLGLGDTEVIARFEDFLLVAGNDTILGGPGNDTIIPDFFVYGLVDNNNLTQEVLNFDGIDYVQMSDSFGNTIRWGNDIMSGGPGEDRFVWNLVEDTNGDLVMQGYDQILDLNLSKDTLAFGGVESYSKLEDSTSVLTGPDSTVIAFDQGGSITLHGVLVSSLSDLNIITTPANPDLS